MHDPGGPQERRGTHLHYAPLTFIVFIAGELMVVVEVRKSRPHKNCHGECDNVSEECFYEHFLYYHRTGENREQQKGSAHRHAPSCENEKDDGRGKCEELELRGLGDLR